MKTKQNLYALCECGIMVALAVVLSLPFLSIPWFWALGGSVSLCAVPLLLIGYRHGLFWGLGAGLVFGLADCLISGGIGYGLPSVLLDYVLAYGMLGLAGLFRKKGLLWLELGALVGNLARFAIHFLSGITIYRIALGDEIELFGHVFGADEAVLYSILYNGSYMLPNLLLSLLVLGLLYPALQKLEQKAK